MAAMASSSLLNTRAGLREQHLLGDGAALDDRAVRREVAAQDHQAAGLGIRLVERADDLVVVVLLRLISLAQRHAGDGQRIFVEQAAPLELAEHAHHAARQMQVDDVGDGRPAR